jgi:hypothetical protein
MRHSTYNLVKCELVDLISSIDFKVINYVENMLPEDDVIISNLKKKKSHDNLADDDDEDDDYDDNSNAFKNYKFQENLNKNEINCSKMKNPTKTYSKYILLFNR